ncbi:MAG: hypothetical protein RL376_677 [Verrucomicrobiota bacterium]|jgi:DUF1365 family protein
MNSRLYECRILHARLHPRAHRFSYRIFLLALDLDELPALSRRLRLLGIDRGGLLSFRQRDYLPTHETAHNPTPGSPAAAASTREASCALAADAPLKTRLLATLAARGIDPGPNARVLLLTLPRVLGYQFNPVSFYFVHTADGRPVASVAEVTNTFRETKPFFLGPDTLSAPSSASPAFHLRIAKNFYVSPFSDVDVAFDFTLRPPGEHLDLQIDDYIGPRRTLITTVKELHPPRPLTDRALAWFSLKYPAVTLKVIAAIHWEAFRLFLKRVPWFAKAARPADQRDLYHPHSSLSPRRQPEPPAP